MPVDIGGVGMGGSWCLRHDGQPEHAGTRPEHAGAEPEHAGDPSAAGGDPGQEW
ncbi:MULTISPECIES: hypothetical protein [unclassified Micromonospora]|uniref:hypothetical protein n=1 Tax=unclassified Micromonospora TaxID=2617518 RepID=UPI003A8963E7